MAEQSVRPKRSVVTSLEIFLDPVTTTENCAPSVSDDHRDKSLRDETAFGLFLEKVREWTVLHRKAHFTRTEFAKEAMTVWDNFTTDERQVFVDAYKRRYPNPTEICRVGPCADRRYSILHTLSETKDQCRRYGDAFHACQHLLNDKENQILHLKKQLQAYEERFELMKTLFEARPVYEEYISQV
jgi:hypothetical protein